MQDWHLHRNVIVALIIMAIGSLGSNLYTAFWTQEKLVFQVNINTKETNEMHSRMETAEKEIAQLRYGASEQGRINKSLLAAVEKLDKTVDKFGTVQAIRTVPIKQVGENTKRIGKIERAMK